MEMLDKLRYAGNIHAIMREYLKSILRPGIRHLDICNILETKNYGHIFPAFPACISCDNVLAHCSPSSSCTKTIQYNNVIKIDYGYIYDGYIIDGAFTKIFNPVFQPLVDCANDAVSSTIKQSRPDILLNELSENIKEIVESYSLNLNGKIYDIRPTKNLGGHTIMKNVLHGNKFLPGVPIESNENVRMESDEIWAIEIFPTTGKGIGKETDDIMCTNYGIINNSYGICESIYDKYKNLPFNLRWIENEYDRFELHKIINHGYIKKYKPLVDEFGSYSSQTEHTIHIGEMKTENFTE